MKKNTFYLVSLGCAKNLVDSDSMAALLQQSGLSPVEKATQANFLIVNSCGFIKAARDESIQVLQELAEQKKRGQYLIAAGCLSQRYREDISNEVAGIDGILGTRRWMDIVDVVGKIQEDRQRLPFYHLPDVPTVGQDEKGIIRAAVQGKSAYLKIADGCRRPCAFCAIPQIKGTAVSRPLEIIISEAHELADLGVLEINLIAQDTTDYGYDLGIKDGLAQLLERLATEIPQIPWIRVLYAYPGYITERLIEVMSRHPQILRYIDMPLQHAEPRILKSMKRPTNVDWIYKTVEKLRKNLPGLALRTTFIVGYPGETEKDFSTLLDMVKTIEFDHVGAFIFSFEKGTSSEFLGDPIPLDVKQERLERLMLLQESISLKRNQSFIGKTLPVIVEGMNNDLSIGRSYRDAPEIDGLVIIENQAPVGKIIPVSITGAMIHDLSGIADLN